MDEFDRSPCETRILAHDMHELNERWDSLRTVSVCLCVSPDLDGYRYRATGQEERNIDPERPTKGPKTHMICFVSRCVCFTICFDNFTIEIVVACFTICLFISPDLDGHRAPKMKGGNSGMRISNNFAFPTPNILL